MKRIAVFASGSGSNAQNITEFIQADTSVVVDCILCNNPKAQVLERAQNLHIPAFTFDRHQFYETNEIATLLRERSIDLIVLAGFLWLIPENLIQQFRIINIHPALLPKYGGKGMYGMHVHNAVVANKEKESGISIHYVNEIYDEGKIIFQAKCEVLPDDTPEDVAKKVHQLEYEHYPKVIKKLLLDL